MKKFIIVSLIVVMAGVLCIGYAHATAFPPPSPYLGLTFGNDVESGIFSHGGSVLSIEILDVGDLFVTGSAFGFYFNGDDMTNIANFHPIFEIADGPSLPIPTQIAIIDFNLGQVLDGDALGTVQHVFTPSTANIGFWVFPLAGAGIPVMFTDPSLNLALAGADVSGTFPITSTPESDDYLITFEIPGVTEILTAHYVGGIVPVPEPSSVLFLATGLAGLLIYKKRKIK